MRLLMLFTREITISKTLHFLSLSLARKSLSIILYKIIVRQNIEDIITSLISLSILFDRVFLRKKSKIYPPMKYM